MQQQNRIGRRTLALVRVITATTLFCGIGLVLPLKASRPDHKPSYRVLYKFTGGADGNWPEAGVIQDRQGNLYGTAYYGGSFDFGTVYKREPSSKFTVLHSFDGVDGMSPFAALVQDAAGNLYGTTTDGGTGEGGGCTHGCGTAFKIDASGKYSVLHAFTGGSDGSQPRAALILDSEGNLYGTTPAGGNSQYPCNYGGCGVVFKLDRHGKETVLYTFTGGTDGLSPSGGLVRDGDGNVYGVTGNGGASGGGTVFKVDPNGVETVLYSFTGGTDGNEPIGSLVFDEAGNLYGMTRAGGDSACGYDHEGCGVVFKVDPNGTETVLYTFSEMEFEAAGGLLRDHKGDLYGTSGECCGGVLFKVKPDGKFLGLHFFGSGVGTDPNGGVIMDKAGNLFGTTFAGGSQKCKIGQVPGCGVIYKWTP